MRGNYFPITFNNKFRINFAVFVVLTTYCLIISRKFTIVKRSASSLLLVSLASKRMTKTSTKDASILKTPGITFTPFVLISSKLMKPNI